MRALVSRRIGITLGASWALAVVGCSTGGSDQAHVIVAEFDGVVVSAEVPGRITGTDSRLLSFTAENRSAALATVWIAFAVDGLGPGCEIANVENWSDLEDQASNADRFPTYRLQPGESSRGALNSLVNPDCIGTRVDVVMMTGSPDPNGEFVSARTTVEIG